MSMQQLSGGEKRENEGMHNSFPSRNRYVPWDPEKADDDGLIDGKSEPPPYNRCMRVSRGMALSYITQEILNRYRDKAYLGANVINKEDNKLADGREGGLITLPLDDYSQDEQEDFDKKLEPLLNVIENPSGVTPTGQGIYHALKILRGGALTLRNGSLALEGRGDNRYFPYYRTKTPLRYRCQTSHIVNMSDGESGGSYTYGVFEEDFPYLTEIKYPARSNNLVIGGVNLTYYAPLYGNFYDIGRLIANVDLRRASKPIWDETSQRWVEKTLDDAGKPWNDPRYSTKMPVVMNSISLAVDPEYLGFKYLVEPSGGTSIGFAPGKDAEGRNREYTTEDLLTAFDTIFSNIVQSSSSTLAVNDKVYADVLPHKVEMRNGRLYLDGKLTDLSNVGAIRYSTSYGFNQRYGVISAVVPYIIKENFDGKDSKSAEIGLYELWNTNQTIRRGQGNYVTYLNKDQGYKHYPVGTWLYRVHSGKALLNFIDIYRKDITDNNHNDAWHYHVHWLYEFTRTNFWPYSLRPRMTPMGSIINSDIRLANKDILNINISNKTMSQQLSKEMTKWLQYKAQWQPKNYIIASDNDGFINFINAQRGLNAANRYKGGHLDTAYFPQISYRRINDIATKNNEPVFVFDGHTNLTDAKVYQEGRGNYYATLGMTGMGAGGKGLVGYRIFASDMNMVDNWIDNERRPSLPASYSNPIDKVTPMFEITNEGKPEFRTRGFENLGYTYSGFEYFNRYITKNNEKRGQAVAVFGNGFGTEKSTVYFIDAYTGEKLNEVILNHNGGGAASPAIVVAADATEGQRILSLYVGDYSGTLYKVEFNNKDFTDNSSIRITALFKAPVTKVGQSAISTRPLVISNVAGQKQIFFGTGLAADKKLDRGSNAAVLHNIYGITDRNLRDEQSISTAEYMMQNRIELVPLLSVNNLKRGDVKYHQGTQVDYLQENRYDVDIITPEDPTPNNTNNARLDGWYVRLSADGMNSGERVIQDPKYDGINRSVIFSTWGVVEREDVNDNGLYDPCLRDSAFGKILAFNLATGGGAIGGGNGGLSNVGSVGTIPGGITGDLINQGPDDNSTTSLDDLGSDLVEELIKIVGESNSSLSKGKDLFGATCEGTINSEGRCVSTTLRVPKPPIKLHRQRVDMRKIL